MRNRGGSGSPVYTSQDQWTIDRLTLNLGVRVDFMDGWVPAQSIEESGSPSFYNAGTSPNGWVPARSFDKVEGLPRWRDINPRLGMAYDVSGDGRTALKLSLGRYVRKTGVDIARSFNPINTSVNSVGRSWNDANGNFFPDCDLGNFSANGECAAIRNSNFGQNNPNATVWSDDVNGWGKRDNNWDLSAEVQQEVVDGLSVTAGYYFNNGGYYNADSNVRIQDNLSIGPSDFDEYCVTAPVDGRLPGGGGNEICGLYDLKPEKFGQINNLVTETSNYGVGHPPEPLHQSELGRATPQRHPVRRRDRHREIDEEPLHRGRFTGASNLLPGRRVWRRPDPVLRRHQVVFGADAAQDVREHPAAVWLRGERDLSEPVGPRSPWRTGRRPTPTSLRRWGAHSRAARAASSCRSSVRRSCTRLGLPASTFGSATGSSCRLDLGSH